MFFCEYILSMESAPYLVHLYRCVVSRFLMAQEIELSVSNLLISGTIIVNFNWLVN